MLLKRHITLLLCILPLVAAVAQGGKKARLDVGFATDGVLTVHFCMPEPKLIPAGQGFSLIACEGLTFGTGKVGHPDLPTASTLIRLPKGSALTVNAVDADEVQRRAFVLADEPLAPVTGPWFKDQPAPGYEPDAKVYANDAFYRGGESVAVEHLGRMGEEEIYLLTVSPVAYNPASGDLLITRTLNATLSTTPRSPLSTLHSPLPTPRYLVVSRPEFREGLQPFVRWKRQEGYDVVERYAGTASCDSVKALIAGVEPDYILLVGDVEQINAFPGTVLLEEVRHITDLYYSDFSGDYLPEAMVGRWPVSDTAELNTVVRKTLDYEQFRDIDTAQLRRILLVAGTETASTAPVTTNGQVNYLSRETALAHPAMDTVCYHNPASDTLLDAIVADISLGASLLNYTAHCTEAGWTRPALRIGNLTDAGGDQPMVYVNNCCKSNNFGGDCFGEQLLRLPTGGAVGVVGATNSTLWNEDYYWAVGPKYPLSLTPAYDSSARGAFDGLIGAMHTVSTLGDLLVAGNLAVTAFGSSHAKFYWEIYCLLGDPSLMPYIDVPSPIDLMVTEGLVNGSLRIEVAGTPGARVAAMQGDSLLGAATLDASGHTTIALRQPLDTLPLLLTATGFGLQPRIDTLTVDGNIAEGVTLRNVALTDSTITCLVENIGHTRMDSLRVMLSQSADDSLAGALIALQTLQIDSLLPSQQTAVTLPVVVEAIGMQPLWQASLMVLGDSLLCALPLHHALPAELPTLTLRLLNPDGSEARQMLPARHYLLQAEVDGTYDSLTLFADSHTSLFLSPSTIQTLAFTTPDSLCDLSLGGTLYLQHWQSRNEYHLEPGSRTDGFEKGFDAHPWRNNSRMPWVIDSTVSHSGRYSARSGAIGHSQLTDLCLEVYLPHSDSLSFWSKASTETRYDKMVFMVDGERRLPENWGDFGWSEYRHTLSPGHHTLCWRYIKDIDRSQGSDCIWIDDVRLPMSLWDSAGDWGCSVATMGIDELSIPNAQLSIYPNPASTHITVVASQPTALTILDLQGRTVIPATALSTKHHLNVSMLRPGIYFVTASNVADSQGIKLIIKNN